MSEVTKDQLIDALYVIADAIDEGTGEPVRHFVVVMEQEDESD